MDKLRTLLRTIAFTSLLIAVAFGYFGMSMIGGPLMAVYVICSCVFLILSYFKE